MPHRPTLARSSGRVVYVAAGRLAAAQWRCHLAREALSAGRRVVLGAEVVPYRVYAAMLWEAHRAPGEPMLLSPRQSRALWRRVVAESPEGERLLGAAGPARWAEDAWRAAVAFRIDVDAARGRGRGTDFAVFSRWAAAYRTRLRDSGWIDDVLLDGALARRRHAAATPLVLADFEPTPAQQAVLARLEEAGTRIELLAPPACADGRAAAFRCADPIDELAAASEWAATRFAASPDRCFAIVVPDLGERAAEVRRVLGDALRTVAGREAIDALHVAGDRSSADARALPGAALNALELLSPSAGFRQFSRWLRSPFFHDERARGAAALLERRLREDLLVQLPFLEAWRGAGLAARTRAALPDAAARIEAALERLPGPEARRSPAAWAALWPRLLDVLGGASWHASRRSAPAEHELYEEALVDLARLGPIVGALSAGEALAELEEGLSREPPAALPLAGVHVLGSLEDVGPGYAGVWVCGASDERLPRPVELRPFLPPDVQIEAGMPWSAPDDALARSRALLERIAARVPEAIYSWPEHIRDEPVEPSPLIRGLPPFVAGIVALARAPGRRRESVPDLAPPLAGDGLPGGAAALNAQSSCPLRAFCEHRLGARPLTPLAPGVSAGTRGRIMHRTLEHLFRRFDSRRALDRTDGGELLGALRREALRAAADTIGRGHVLLDAFVEIEAARVVEVVAAYIARERERARFRVGSLELDETLEIGERKLRLRIDRVDELESGGLAVIDYKTGQAPRPVDWLAPRLRDVQLPLYALTMPADRLAALVVAVLRTGRAAYSGLWDDPEAFPGRGRAVPVLHLADLLDTWRERITALVAEYAAGDLRLFVDGSEAAAGPFAPLTRVYELLAPITAPDAPEGR